MINQQTTFIEFLHRLAIRTARVIAIVVITRGLVLGGVLATPSSATPVLTANTVLTLAEAIDLALKNNPRIRSVGKDVETEMYNLRAAKAERMPRVDLTSGVTRYRYPTPLTPIVIKSPSALGLDIPRFEQTIYDAGAVLRLPLYRGGRLQRNVAIAELRKAIAEDNLRFGKEDLTYNVASVYYKVLQLEQLWATSDATVKQLEAHRRDVETLYRVGSVAYLDLIKTDVELGHTIQNRLQVENNLESAYELLRTLIGSENADWRPVLTAPVAEEPVCSAVNDCRQIARNNRADLKAMQKRLRIGDERVKIAQGKRYPDVSLAGEYVDRSGTDFAYKENWDVSVRMTIPLFDGGIISAEVARETNELAKLKEEGRALNLTIEKEAKEAFLDLGNARSRMTVAEATVLSAKENVRVENLKYQAGSATNTDVIDAQTALLRAETDLCQARFDRETAVAALKRAVGHAQAP
jgi:outer membrane protein